MEGLPSDCTIVNCGTWNLPFIAHDGHASYTAATKYDFNGFVARIDADCCPGASSCVGGTLMTCDNLCQATMLPLFRACEDAVQLLDTPIATAFNEAATLVSGPLQVAQSTEHQTRCQSGQSHSASRCQCGATVNECASHPCSNSAACIDGFSSYLCACQLGYTGDRCEVDSDECASGPCGVGGACVDTVAR